MDRGVPPCLVRVAIPDAFFDLESNWFNLYRSWVD
ncbi:hypothetical protein DESC_720277 [Desulfosarcina cetonica]|nr:hypothetical protein DESC_720277 [Desulfosarcina cetonica]